MVDMKWWINFFFLMVVVTLVLKLLAGSALPAALVGIPLLLFVGSLFLGKSGS